MYTYICMYLYICMIMRYPPPGRQRDVPGSYWLNSPQWCTLWYKETVLKATLVLHLLGHISGYCNTVKWCPHTRPAPLCPTLPRGDCKSVHLITLTVHYTVRMPYTFIPSSATISYHLFIHCQHGSPIPNYIHLHPFTLSS